MVKILCSFIYVVHPHIQLVTPVRVKTHVAPSEGRLPRFPGKTFTNQDDVSALLSSLYGCDTPCEAPSDDKNIAFCSVLLG